MLNFFSIDDATSHKLKNYNWRLSELSQNDGRLLTYQSFSQGYSPHGWWHQWWLMWPLVSNPDTSVFGIHEVNNFIEFNIWLIHAKNLVLTNHNKIIFQSISTGCISEFHFHYYYTFHRSTRWCAEAVFVGLDMSRDVMQTTSPAEWWSWQYQVPDDEGAPRRHGTNKSRTTWRASVLPRMWP